MIPELGETKAEEEIAIETQDEVLTKNKKYKKSRTKSIILDICLYAAIFLFCIRVVPEYVIQRTLVTGKSMENTLHEGESLLVEKMSYLLGDPKRFDIIVFNPYGKEIEERFVKRVIGLPGETVQIIGETIFINGEILEEEYGKDPIENPGIAAEPITLADDEYFVMGDNRTVSMDSRSPEVGLVHRNLITGQAVLRVWPLKTFGTIE